MSVRPAERPAGVRLVGYLDAELGMGELGRGVLSVLRAAGEPVVTATETVTLSRRRHDAGVRDGEDRRSTRDPDDADVNLVCVNADRLPMVIDRLGTAFTSDRYTIGVWAWEVEEFPPHLRGSGGLVDEVWTCSAHARDAIAAGVDVPVHRVPPPVLPRPSVARPRHELGLPEGFTFLFCFDFFSVVDRKNPFGVIDAFCRAFAPGEGPHLLIKSINGEATLLGLERVRLHAAGRDDVHVVDGYVSAPEQAALSRLRRLRVAAPGRGVRLHDGRGDARRPAGRGDRVLGEPRVHGRSQQRPRRLRPRPDRRGQRPVPRRVAVGGPRRRRGRGGDAAPRRRPGRGGRAGRARPAGRPPVPQPAAGADRGRPAGGGPLVPPTSWPPGAALEPGSPWVRARRLGRAGVREAVRVGRRLGQSSGRAANSCRDLAAVGAERRVGGVGQDGDARGDRRLNSTWRSTATPNWS